MNSWWHYLNNEEYYRNNRHVERFSYQRIGDFLRAPLTDFLRYSYSQYGKFDNVVDRWAKHVRGWLDRANVVVRYEDLVGSVGLHEVPSVLLRKGTIDDWKNYLNEEDEQFIMEYAKGISWKGKCAMSSGDSSTIRLES